ncbi:MAG: M20/M25/M40 family metallo-hydrolase, partial [Anaerolineae bacterium]|nr:M20/M25/M40 family metallo-hydrolase [Anaerolineae bacterium]
VMRQAVEHGAGGLLLLNPDAHQLTHKRTYRQAPWLERSLPVMIVNERVAAALVQGSGYSLDDLTILYRSLPLATRVRLEVLMDEPGEVQGQNVLGALPGADPARRHEVLILGAHYDHLGLDPNGDHYAGANDDASGVAVLLEIARSWREQGYVPERTVLLAAWDGEEQGLLGSRYYAEHPVYPLRHTVGMIQLDMVGLATTGTMTIDGLAPANEAELVSLSTEPRGDPVARQLGHSASLLGVPVRPSSFRGMSDHAPFMEAGVPASLLIWDDGDVPYYHTPEDVWQTLQPERLWQAGALTAHAAMALATQAPQIEAAMRRRAEAFRQEEREAWAALCDPEDPQYAAYALAWFDAQTLEIRQSYTSTLQSVVVGDADAVAWVEDVAVDAQGQRLGARYPTRWVRRGSEWLSAWPAQVLTTTAHLNADSVHPTQEAKEWLESLEESYTRAGGALDLDKLPALTLTIYPDERALRWLAPASLGYPLPAYAGLPVAAGASVTLTAASLLLDAWGLPRGEGEWLRAGLAGWLEVAAAGDSAKALRREQVCRIPATASVTEFIQTGAPLDSGETAIAYSLVDLLIADHGVSGLRALAAAWGGRNLESGLAALGLTPESLRQGWEAAYLAPLQAAREGLAAWVREREAAVRALDRAAYAEGIADLDPIYAEQALRWFEALDERPFQRYQLEAEVLEASGDRAVARVTVLARHPKVSQSGQHEITLRFTREGEAWRAVGPDWRIWAGEGVKLYALEARGDEATLLRTTETAYDQVCATLGCIARSEIHVQLYPDQAMTDWQAALYGPRAGESWYIPQHVVFLARPQDIDSVYPTLIEALARMVLAQRPEVPAWLQEGIALYLASRGESPRARELKDLIETAREAQRFDGLYDWGGMPEPDSLSASEREVLQGQALYLVERVAIEGGGRALEHLLDALGRGQSWREAFRTATGLAWEVWLPGWEQLLAHGGVSQAELDVARSFDVERVLATIGALTAPELTGRRAGSPEAERAARWIAERMAALGLGPIDPEDSYLHPVPVSYGELAETPVLRVRGDGDQEIAFTFPGQFRELVGGHAGDGAVDGQVVWLVHGFGEEMRLGGRIAVTDSRGDPVALAAEAQAHEAGGCIVVRPHYVVDERTLYAEAIERQTIPTAEITEETWQAILELAGYSLADVRMAPPALLLPLRAELRVPLSVVQGATAWDVIGRLPGSDPSASALVIMAHYDGVGALPDGTLYPGANKGVSGVATLLEVARLWHQSGRPPARPIYFIALGAEEVDHASARRYGTTAPILPDRPGQIIVLDSLGEARSYWFNVDVEREDDPLAGAMLLAGELLERRVSLGKSGEANTHTILRQQRLPSALLFWPNPSLTHTPQDRVETLDRNKLATAGETLTLACQILAR